VGGLRPQSRTGEREIFIFPAFSLVRTSRKDALKEFETAIKMALQILNLPQRPKEHPPN